VEDVLPSAGDPAQLHAVPPGPSGVAHLQACAASATAVTGGGWAALLVSDGGPHFELAAASGDVPLPPVVPVDPLASPLWPVAMGGEPPVATDGEHLGLAGVVLAAAGLRRPSPGLGLLVSGDPPSGSFDEATLQRLGILAELAGAAVANADVLQEYQHLEEMLGAAVQMSAALVRVQGAAAVRRELLRRLVEDMGAAAAVLWQQEGDGHLLLALAHGLPEEVHTRIDRLPVASRAGELLVQGRDAVGASSWPGHTLRLARVPGPTPAVLGVYSARPLPELFGRVLETLAHALAAAVEQANLHSRVQSVVDSLQRELRPRNVTLPPGVEIGTHYQSATSGVEVGGDFYDYFTTRDGHLGLVCGDVSGKGVEAASLTAMAVYSLRAFALQGTTPQMVLKMTNGTVCGQTASERFMTLAYARVDPVDWTGHLALAGHPPPVLVSQQGVRVLTVIPDIPVGLVEEATYDQVEFALQPGESLVLYTDGVTEARRAGGSPGDLLGVDGLVRVLEGLRGADADTIASGVWNAVQEWTDDGTTDDTALVVLRRLPDGA
jgi:serine phosphatase RsbU (regulator of sigma subunit)